MRSPPFHPPSIPSAAPAGRAFTVIELLVVIVVIAVLIALILPALAPVRDSARLNARLQTARQLNASLMMYCADHRERFPFFGTPGNALGPITIRGFTVPGQFFQTQRWFWASAVVPEYFDPRHAIEPPGQAEHKQKTLGWPESIVGGLYQMTSTAFAAPAFWSEDPSGQKAWLNESYLRPTSLADIQHHGAKGLLGEALAGPRGGGGYPLGPSVSPVAIADGSARLVNWSQLDWGNAVERPWGAGGMPIESTRDGLRGIDF